MEAEDAADAPRSRLGRAFSWLLASSSFSNLADGIVKVALPLLAARQTDDPMLIAAVAAALSLPWLVFALPAGVMADRLDRQLIMLVANFARGAGFGTLAIASIAGAPPIVVLLGIALVIGIAEVCYDTVAQSLLPAIVDRPLLTRANGRLQAAETVTNQFLGQPIAGFLMGASVVLAAAVPAALWFVAVACLLGMRGSFTPDGAGPRRRGIVREIGDGLRYLFFNPLLRVLAVLVGGFNLASSAVFSVFVLFAVGSDAPMGLDERGYGLLLTAIALGSLLGALLAERLQRLVGRARLLVVAIPVGTCLFLAPALTSQPAWIASAFFVGGMGIAVFNVLAVSLRQALVPDRLLGRVNSAYRMIAWGAMPIGALLGGTLASIIGLQPLFASTTVLALALCGTAFLITERRLATAEDSADT